MKRILEALTSSRHGQRGLLCALIALLLIAPLLGKLSSFQLLFSVAFMLVLITAVRSLADNKAHVRVAIALSVIAAAGQLGLMTAQSGWLFVTRDLASVLLMFWVSLVLLRHILVRSRAVTIELIYGAVNIYLMVGLGFGFLYALLEFLQPGSFSVALDTPGISHQVSHMVYFSFVTLSTLGYGDITPESGMATTLAYMEAIFGQLFLAVLVARLVGMHIVHQRETAGERTRSANR